VPRTTDLSSGLTPEEPTTELLIVGGERSAAEDGKTFE
jgi:hypothetical protein